MKIKTASEGFIDHKHGGEFSKKREKTVPLWTGYFRFTLSEWVFKITWSWWYLYQTLLFYGHPLVFVLERCDCTRRLTFQVSSFNWRNNISFFVFVFEILLPQKRKLDPLKSFKYHKHQHKGNKVWTVFGFFLLWQHLQLSLFLTQVTISHSYFSSHHRECFGIAFPCMLIQIPLTSQRNQYLA